jgi:hypothetical protein
MSSTKKQILKSSLRKACFIVLHVMQKLHQRVYKRNPNCIADPFFLTLVQVPVLVQLSLVLYSTSTITCTCTSTCTVPFLSLSLEREYSTSTFIVQVQLLVLVQVLVPFLSLSLEREREYSTCTCTFSSKLKIKIRSILLFFQSFPRKHLDCWVLVLQVVPWSGVRSSFNFTTTFFTRNICTGTSTRY